MQALITAILRPYMMCTVCCVLWQLFTGKATTYAADAGVNNGQSQAVRDAYSLLHRERDKGRPLTLHITQPSSTPSGLSSSQL